MKELTRIQQQTIEFIEAFIAENGYAPTLREMAEYFGVSHEAIADRIYYIEQKGRIKCAPNKARAIRILPAG